jgi:peroxiredoxin
VVEFFYSTPEALGDSFAGLAPDFELVGDPDRIIFDRFGVERSHRKFLDPRSISTGMSGWFKGAKFQPVANLTQDDTAGVPADFLIDADGILRHVHYGSHGADSLTVDEVLTAHRAVTRAV